jgi:hypothetical protein
MAAMRASAAQFNVEALASSGWHDDVVNSKSNPTERGRRPILSSSLCTHPFAPLWTLRE